MLTRLFKRARNKVEISNEFTYDQQKLMAQDPDPAVRLRLAEYEDARPEVLYFLANDEVEEIRRAVAANQCTPVQADVLLTDDQRENVRADLARKIGRLAPDMPNDEQERVRELTFEVLEKLASDQLPRIRAIIADEIKHATTIPRHVVLKLARDTEAIVSTSILEYSPLLSDADLIEIIAAGTAQEALSAVSKREGLSGGVSDALVATLDVPAIATLLANKSAQIREETLDFVVENAENIDSWHEPLVLRPELSIRAVRRIATFVATSLVEVLARRNDLTQETIEEIRNAVKHRLDDSTGAYQEYDEDRALRMFEQNMLNDQVIQESLESKNYDFVIQAMALLSGLKKQSVQRIFETRNGHVITALAWKAKLGMRTAIRLQSTLGHVAPKKIVNARGGFDFPMKESEMELHLSSFS
jgi:uncharacterized protein (DUF2336 family)